MVRLSEQRSRAARWSRRIATFAVPLVVLTTLLHRFASLDTPPAMAVLGLGIALALIALLLGFVAAWRIWDRGHRGLADTAIGIVLATAILAIPVWHLPKLFVEPRLNDITTDWTAQLALEAAARERPPGANPVDYAGAEAARRQAEAYPEIGPLTVNYASSLVYESAVALVADRGWRVQSSQAPAPESYGRIEAEARTLVFGFRDDVVVRIRHLGPEQTRIDMRSASRYGAHDLGANAARIYDFFDDLRQVLETGLLPGEELPGGDEDFG